MSKRNNNRQRQNTARKQARADLWDMVNAFVTTPEMQAIHFANEVGEINITRAEREPQHKRIGFAITYAVGGNEIDTHDDEDEDDDQDVEDEVRPAEEFVDYIRKIFKR